MEKQIKDGFLLINKSADMTSFDIIRNVKKKYPKIKLGHTGTLDKTTTGLVVLAVNKGTKFIPLLTENSHKKYIATMQFGIKTDTGDLSGKVIKKELFKMPKEQVLKQLFKTFEKTYEQMPPSYSAKKINGVRASDLIRKGKAVELKPSQITIKQLDIINVLENKITFTALVSKGTYIRSLITDLAQELNTVAVMSFLKRVETDGFSLKEATKIEAIDFKKGFIELEDFLLTKYVNKIYLEGKTADLIKNGLKIKNKYLIEAFDQQIIDGSKAILFLEKNSNHQIAIYKRNISDKVTESYQQQLNLWGSHE